jgi:hypothetical protein
MLEVDGRLDEVVDVEWRAAVGAAGVVLDVLYFMKPGVDSSPGRLIGYGSTCAGDTVDDEDGVGHRIGGD